MRIRFKPWARPELEASKFYIDNPESYKGKWKEIYKNNNPLHLELGCGKGGFISELAVNNLDVNYVAVDLVDAMLGIAKRKIEEKYRTMNCPQDNIYITRYDIERIDNIFSKEDEIKRIYINFCNPWPKGKHRKKRLTHTRQLEKYKQFLANDGEIFFKTDDDGLFGDSIKYFEQSGFNIEKLTYNLEQETDFWNNIETEHEKMFKEQGISIKALIARM